MGRRGPERARFIVGLVLVGGAVVVTAWVYHGDLTILSFLVALVGLLVGIASLWLSLRPPAPRRVDELASELADAVYDQWSEEAIRRRLTQPQPIPIRWSLEAHQGADGGLDALQEAYAGLASGRLVVLGAPGAGKSATAILLLLKALNHRNSVGEGEQTQVPVPILLTAHGWDPQNCSVRDWLADQLTERYPMRGGRAEAASLVKAQGKVALILDGLDDMDQALLPAALRQLSTAPFRVVLLTRKPETTQAACLNGALTVHLHDVSALDAADYLQRAPTELELTHTERDTAGWQELLDHLRHHPDGVLARGLSTPLTITLLRDAYEAGDNIRVLLDDTQYDTTDAIEQYLIARVLPDAYRKLPGRPPPRYTEEQARRTLSFIAQKMGKNQDFSWWHVPCWAPAAPRVLAIVLALLLAAGLAGAFIIWLAYGLTGGPLGLLAAGLMFGLIFGLTAVLMSDEPRRARTTNWRAAISRQLLRQALIEGLLFGLVVGLLPGVVVELPFRLVAGLVVGLVTGLAGGLVNASTERGAGSGPPMGPREVWRNDRMFGLAVGFAVGLAVGLAGGLAVGLAGGLAVGLTFGLAVGLTFGLIMGFDASETWPTTLAWLQLWLSRQVFAPSLIPFLEDARERGILRTVGAAYQFRHAKLQDRLAVQPRQRSILATGRRRGEPSSSK